MIAIRLNGEERPVPEGRTVRDLLDDLGFKGRAVAVEINRELVPKRMHPQTTLRDGDVVEVVTLVGGG